MMVVAWRSSASAKQDVHQRDAFFATSDAAVREVSRSTKQNHG
jgi:hypothetical protein